MGILLTWCRIQSPTGASQPAQVYGHGL